MNVDVTTKADRRNKISDRAGSPPAQEPPAAGSRPAAAGRARTQWSLYLAGMALLVVLLFVVKADAYWLNIITLAYLFGGLASAWNVIGGLGGQLSLGHGVYFAIGAYTVAWLYTKHDVSPWIGLVIAVPVSMVVAALSSFPTFRLRGPFFAMATLALNQVCLVLAEYFHDFTGGTQGLSLPFNASAADLTFNDRWIYGLLMLVFLGITVAVVLGLSRARLGYALRAVREDPEAAAAAGIDVFRTKLRGLLMSAPLTAIGGGLFAVFQGYIDPDSVLSLPDVSVRIALIALLGGIGTVWGPVIGALVFLPAITQLQGQLSSVRPGIDLAAVGLLLVVIPLVLRRGIVGTAAELTRWARRRWAR